MSKSYPTCEIYCIQARVFTNQLEGVCIWVGNCTKTDNLFKVDEWNILHLNFWPKLSRFIGFSDRVKLKKLRILPVWKIWQIQRLCQTHIKKWKWCQNCTIFLEEKDFLLGRSFWMERRAFRRISSWEVNGMRRPQGGRELRQLKGSHLNIAKGTTNPMLSAPDKVTTETRYKQATTSYQLSPTYR